MDVSSSNGWFCGNPVEGITLVILGQGNGFDVADLAVQTGQLAFRIQFEFEFLAMLELAELFGLFVAGQDFVNGGSRQADLFEQGRQGIALGNDDFAMARRFWLFGGWRRCSLCGLRGVFATVFDLSKWRSYWLICGLSCVSSVLILCQLFSRTFQFKTQGRFFGFHIAGREYQERQAEKGGDSTCGEQVGLRVKRRRFRRFFGHKWF
ncbi:hypothetical protein D3C87_1156230 [compost metagenome]